MNHLYKLRILSVLYEITQEENKYNKYFLNKEKKIIGIFPIPITA